MGGWIQGAPRSGNIALTSCRSTGLGNRPLSVLPMCYLTYRINLAAYHRHADAISENLLIFCKSKGAINMTKFRLPASIFRNISFQHGQSEIHSHEKWRKRLNHSWIWTRTHMLDIPLCISMYVKQHQLMIIHTLEESQTGAI